MYTHPVFYFLNVYYTGWMRFIFSNCPGFFELIGPSAKVVNLCEY